MAMVTKKKKGQRVPPVLKDPRYLEFATRYRDDLPAFLEDVCGLELTHQQFDIADAIQVDGARVSVSSGHGTGKSHETAGISLHFVICHPMSLVMLTANSIDQVLNVVFKYIKDVWRSILKTTPWLAQYFIVIGKSFYAKGAQGEWHIFGKTAAKGNEEALAGNHNVNYLVVVDEASGLSQKAMDFISGALTQKNNKILMISQFTRPSGPFADSQGRLAKTPENPDGIYTRLILNSEESPLVTDRFIREKRIEYGGVDSPQYQIRVLGVCPDNVEGFLISRKVALKGWENEIEHDGFGFLGLVDVAAGEGRDSSILNIMKVSGFGLERRMTSVEIHEFKNTGIDQFIMECQHIGAEYPNITYAIDADGMGFAAVQKAEEIGMNHVRIRWGFPNHSKAKQKDCVNQRAYALCALRDGLESGQVELFDGGVEHNARVIEQLTRIPYSFDEKSRWRIAKKSDMAAKGIKSPDIVDTYAFAFLVDYIPVGEEEDGGDLNDYLSVAADAFD